ncbi:MAG: class I adenylate-forming enzyme family protein [Hyphomicrobium sp.]
MPTIDSVIARAAALAPDQIAIREWKGRQIRYAELDAAVSSFAAWTRSVGTQEGDVVAIHLPNSVAYLVAQFGSFRAGGVAAYVNNRLSATEALRQCRLCNARIIVTTPEKAADLQKAPELAQAIFVVDGPAGPGMHNLWDVVAAQRRPSFTTDGLEDRDAIIRFTSGSTGDPKGPHRDAPRLAGARGLHAGRGDADQALVHHAGAGGRCRTRPACSPSRPSCNAAPCC